MLGHTCEAVKRWPTSVSNVCVTTWTMLCSPLKSTGTYGKNERMSGADATKREKVLEYFVRGKREYESRGSAFARAVQGAPPPPDMDNVPDYLLLLRHSRSSTLGELGLFNPEIVPLRRISSVLALATSYQLI
ncbi:hypothetical protein Y032_0569g89 [Ancylostoma ceylanicum]|uniref:Uncharacterized protein n=1 Tax=Ancylostoma ceylanicum TaxID=53326 RepID=A0A016WNQ8_9BILA|nr:hypothetical protein Y032_0569g89 [Ancylostoma ceylanicum]